MVACEKPLARTLSEALPYLQRYDGATVVIKLGGHAMSTPEAMEIVQRRVMPASNEGRQGHPFHDNRKVVEGIIYRYRAGIPWRDLPSHFGSWKTVWKHHRRNSASGPLPRRADHQNPCPG